MKQSEVNKYLGANFDLVFKTKRFKKTQYRFVKNFGDLYIVFLYAVIDNDNSFPSHFSFGVGSHKLRILSRHILPEKFVQIKGNDFFTAIGTGQLRLFDEGKYPILEYDIYTETDAQKMVDEVSDYILNNVLPEWEANPTNEYLEKKVNESLSDSPNFSRLILAKLVGSSNYETIKAHYINVSKDWSEWDRKDLEKVISFLDSHTQEELQEI